MDHGAWYFTKLLFMSFTEQGFEQSAYILSMDGLIGVVLSGIEDRFIDLPNLCLSVFDHSFCGTYPVGDICLFLIQLFAGAKAVFLNIDDCPGQFQEIGELHFFCISPVLLRLYASLQIGHQSQFRTDIEDCHWVGMIVVCGVISGWVRGRYGLCDQGQRT